MLTTLDGSCFGIDCIKGFSTIKRLTQTSIKSCDQFLELVMARIKAEELYSKNLAKVALMGFEYIEGSSVQISFDQFKSDTNHKAVQHSILAESLMQDVYKPIETLKNQLLAKQKSLTTQYNSLHVEIKGLEDNFKKASTKFERFYKAAIDAYNACVDAGVKLPPHLAPDNNCDGLSKHSNGYSTDNSISNSHMLSSSETTNGNSAITTDTNGNEYMERLALNKVNHDSTSLENDLAVEVRPPPPPSSGINLSSVSSFLTQSTNNLLQKETTKNLFGWMTSTASGITSSTSSIGTAGISQTTSSPILPSPLPSSMQRSSSGNLISTSSTSLAAMDSPMPPYTNASAQAFTPPAVAVSSGVSVFGSLLAPLSTTSINSAIATTNTTIAGSSSLSLSPAINTKTQQYHTDLINTLMLRLKNINILRHSTRKQWIEYVIICQRFFVKLQIILTKYQGLQESFILLINDHMRKYVVFESSNLANQQYDIQMLFKSLEAVDARQDISNWIRDNSDGFPDVLLHLQEYKLQYYRKWKSNTVMPSEITANQMLGSDQETPMMHQYREQSTDDNDEDELDMLETLKGYRHVWVSDLLADLSHVDDLPAPPSDTVISVPLSRQLPVISLEEMRSVYDVAYVGNHMNGRMNSVLCGDQEDGVTRLDSERGSGNGIAVEEHNVTGSAQLDEDCMVRSECGYTVAEDALKEFTSFQKDLKEIWLNLQETFTLNSDDQISPKQVSAINSSYDCSNNNNNYSNGDKSTGIEQLHRGDSLLSHSSSESLSNMTSNKLDNFSDSLYDVSYASSVLTGESDYVAVSPSKVADAPGAGNTDETLMSISLSTGMNRSKSPISPREANRDGRRIDGATSPLQPSNLSLSIMNDWGLLDGLSSSVSRDVNQNNFGSGNATKLEYANGHNAAVDIFDTGNGDKLTSNQQVSMDQVDLLNISWSPDNVVKNTSFVPPQPSTAAITQSNDAGGLLLNVFGTSTISPTSSASMTGQAPTASPSFASPPSGPYTYAIPSTTSSFFMDFTQTHPTQLDTNPFMTTFSPNTTSASDANNSKVSFEDAMKLLTEKSPDDTYAMSLQSPPGGVTSNGFRVLNTSSF